MRNEQVIKVNKLDIKTIDYINKHYASNPNIVLEINNTKGVSSSMVQMLDARCRIRIIGGYTDDLLKHRSYKEDFWDAVTYSRNEVIQIIRKMEEIEKGILPNWSQLQKTLYIYNKLKSYIIYDKDHKLKDSLRTGDRENRTLRALISRVTVCAGYSITLKEMLDRQGIENEFVIGGTKNHPGNHAWVIAKINGRKFPLDVTWDSGRYRAGFFNNAYKEFINLEEFLEDHVPDMGNETLNYEKELSGLKPEFVERISLPFSRDEQYSITSYSYTRSNGSQIFIAQTNEKIVNGRRFYQYAYIGRDSNSRKYSHPVIIWSENNLAAHEKKKQDASGIIDYDERKYGEALIEKLFTSDNIMQSFRSGSSYIGKVEKNPYTGEYELRKDIGLLSRMPAKEKQFRRNDGTEFVIRDAGTTYIAGRFINSYDLCEFITDSDGKMNFRKNRVFSEQDLLNDSRPEFASEFLSRERINRLSKQCGGYLGSYTNRGVIFYDPNVKAKLKLQRMNWDKDDIVRCSRFQKMPKTFTRSDGTTFTLTRMHRSPRAIYREHLVQYEYKERVPKKGGGYILRKKNIYAQDDLFDILMKPDVVDSEFSREKLSDENLSKTGKYMGRWNENTNTFEYNMDVAKFFINNKGIDFTSTDFSKKLSRIYRKDTKRIKRSDGTTFKLRKIKPEKEIVIYGKRMYQYEYVEDVKIAPWIRERRKHKLFSEEDLLTEKRQEVIDYLLSQKRIAKQAREAGGYLGYYDEKGNRNVVAKRARYFTIADRDFERFPDIYKVDEEEREQELER